MNEASESKRDDLRVSRRGLMTLGAAALTGAVTRSEAAAKPASVEETGFRYCLNTSTIRGQELGIVAEIELAAKAGYDAVEPWIRELDAYVATGGSLKDLGKRIRDAGLTVESAIGFARWIVNDDGERAKGLEQAKRDMDKVAAIGGAWIAAPPVGATKQSDLNLFAAAERYRALLEVGDETGVTPQVEVWGFSQSLSRLGEAVFVAIEAGHPKACLLPDVYHVYKGGSRFDGLSLLSGPAIHCFHVNDYPADPPRETIGDADRVYPGDGVAPLDAILGTLHEHGGCVLSLELFNRDYWKQDALTVAKTGLAKTKAAVAKAVAQRR